MENLLLKEFHKLHPELPDDSDVVQARFDEWLISFDVETWLMWADRYAEYAVFKMTPKA
jgi:hypothetical protein